MKTTRLSCLEEHAPFPVSCLDVHVGQTGPGGFPVSFIYRFFVIGYVTALLLPFVSYPFMQLVHHHGVLCYMNGADEQYYLSYDFVKAYSRSLRPNLFLVCQLHHAGISGGWINFIADIL